jgi:hypothetical protein
VGVLNRTEGSSIYRQLKAPTLTLFLITGREGTGNVFQAVVTSAASRTAAPPHKSADLNATSCNETPRLQS